MKTHWGLLALFVYGVLNASGSLLEFGYMVLKLTGKSAFPYYTSYGCYCGLGGKGQPRDGTDRCFSGHPDSCCFAHDCCYAKLKDCGTKTDRYNYTIEGGNVTCGEGSLCETQICECDRNATICFRDNLDSYDAKYIFYPDIHCTEKDVPC